MGSFVFKWDHPASEVYVTGSFDDWKKTEKLEKVGDHFEKKVSLPDASSKIDYKFVVDGEWVVDHTAPKETDASGNENNFLTPERIISEAPATTAIMSSAAPDSTTAALAASVPLEKDTTEQGKKTVDAENLPGTFPETPAAELNSEGAFGVNPLPAAAGAVNPIKLAPGEKVPEELAAESTTSNVKLDPESYEKSDALPGGVPVILSSAAPESTTAALAADAPIETKVPEIVKESQEKAHVDPEASVVPEEVEEKAALEKELLEKVKAAPTTSEGTAGQGTEKTEDVVTPGEATASVAAAVSVAAGTTVAGAAMTKDAAVEKTQDAFAAAQTTATSTATQLPDSVKENLPESVQNAIGTMQKEEVREEVSPEAPAEVKASITEAGKSPEAAANTEAVEEKKAVEAELLSQVKAVGSSANSEPREEISSEVPAAVKESIDESGRSPEAATNTEAVEEKKAVETELLKEVKPTETTGESAKKEEAPATTEAPETKETPALAVPATTEAPSTSVAAATTEAPAVDTSKAAEQKAATNGAKAAVDPTTSAKPAEPGSKAGDSSATGEKKKKNRLSAMFGKVKAKFSHKD